MSPSHKLRIRLGLLVILTMSGAITVAAQNHAIADNSAVGYRVMDVDYNKDNFVYDTNQRGPIVGMGFKF